jgi:hypothetical protein
MPKAKAPKKKANGNEAVHSSSAPFESSPENGSSIMASSAPAAANGDGKSEIEVKAGKKSARKPEIVKSESRSNLVPINVEEEIRRLAYLMAERRGFAPGHENEDWLAAEHEIRQRYHQTVHSA